MRVIKDIFWGFVILAAVMAVLVFASYANTPTTMSGEVISARVVKNNFGVNTLIVVRDEKDKEHFLGWDFEYYGMRAGDRIVVKFNSDCFYEQKVTETIDRDGWHRFDRDGSRCFDRIKEFKKI